MNIHIHTFGCRLNQYESEKISFELKNMGANITELKNADAIAINTCTVTNDSDKKLINYLDKLENISQKKIFLIGCYVSKKENLFDKENITIIPNDKKEEASKIIFNTLTKNYESEFKNPIFFPQEQSRAYLKIQDGCEVFCSYCIVAKVRGKHKSVEPKKIYDAIKIAYEYGYKEIVLTGLNLGSYNYNNEIKFIQIVKNMLEISSKFGIRIRLSSIEPIYFNDELISLFKNSEVLCPHAHIPLQSGSDKILKLMNRRYTRENYLNIVEKLYKTNSNIGISADIMVGFPNEDSNDFKDTYNLCEKSKFIKMHIFRYSNRENTPSSKMSNQIGYRTKLKRAKLLNELNNKMKDDFYKNAINRELKVIAEKKLENNYYIGTSGEYLKVKFKSEKIIEKKDIIKVKAIKYEDNIIIGEAKNG
ncbi:tRNA (N(6)-L-threonylcarbamoyladenosine(37)-C(2))-methylthiotransferase MtaB [Brachyspira aalborgi]|jgi:threonylcarbamoyladenosine tRNA methylthiotransferase MtaB|uniref:tRNA (N(6)-L-threonylcarbamoyladenosine(37)-C(2))-methylthiotransferase MtaB n=1 Tax=Brachyspira aalborgi TaxID=29522 RepID=A0AB38PT86_9SPIR|nr:tRNA (N(6)-L-threonylcarbamoyladenosine(37)-C(2))-methylthiotransferase MtaB [Brachyspira aalborgi]MBS4764427.1 tRNA (N(6)-L-threonylcarbamoyladenosine(37)-C(2))-methylthiotransferase MtaB [Brachyspira sp.]CCY74094.1 miaB-like tRNA modifying enzyme [Brachyspira sp. CAG:700]TXJ15523.1 tRNA (N(6)-L-threonylcarbamoyladenosine(37)-C(2))-methylthiotransferase MtaB [Brachyspira aalborgi]TXJ17840.1 tRNA (N(6)-L-threonylcarbamoyladenosine(37)-C(2))-methylthiotransferase MtaB [Brachyspira aalborgi]T